MSRMTSFAYTPGPQRAVHGDAAHLQRLHGQALRGEHVAHLRGADAERDRAERAVRRRVAVAARDRHAGLRQSQLRPDDMDDALVGVRDVVERDAELAAVLLERRHHLLGKHVEKRPALIERRHDVIDRRERAVRKRHLAAPHPQHVERLRARHFVDEVKADEQLRLPGGQRAHGVFVPDFLKKCLSHEIMVKL